MSFQVVGELFCFLILSFYRFFACFSTESYHENRGVALVEQDSRFCEGKPRCCCVVVVVVVVVVVAFLCVHFDTRLLWFR